MFFILSPHQFQARAFIAGARCAYLNSLVMFFANEFFVYKFEQDVVFVFSYIDVQFAVFEKDAKAFVFAHLAHFDEVLAVTSRCFVRRDGHGIGDFVFGGVKANFKDVVVVVNNIYCCHRLFLAPKRFCECLARGSAFERDRQRIVAILYDLGSAFWNFRFLHCLQESLTRPL